MKTKINNALKGRTTIGRYIATKILLQVALSVAVGKAVRLLKK